MKTAERHRRSTIVLFAIFVMAVSMIVSARIGTTPLLYGSEGESPSDEGGDKGLRAVAIDPLNPQRIIIGSEKGLLLSTDGGKAWKNVLDLSGAKKTVPLDLGADQKAIIDSVRMPGETGELTGSTALEIDPANSQKVLAGSVDGLYISTDGGENWRKAGGALEGLPLFVLSLSIDPSNPDMIYAGTLDNALLKSFDGGTTWDKVMSWAELEGEAGRKSVTAVAVHPFDSNVIIAGTSDAVFKTKDAGTTWEKANPEVKVAESITFDQVYPDVVYLGTSTGLLKSSDGGASWTDIGADVLGGKQVKAVAVAPSDSSAVYAATSGGVYGSPDKGVSWQNLSKGTGLENAMALAFDPLDNTVIWAATAGGLYKTSLAQAGEKVPEAPAPAEPAVAEEASAEEITPEMTLPSEEEVETISLDQEPASAEGKEEGEAAPEGPPIPTIDDVKTILAQFGHEPTVQEVQEVAMRFAEVHPDLIEGWRKGAKWRALLPDFNIDFEFERHRESAVRNEFEVEREWTTESASAVAQDVTFEPITGTTIGQDSEFSESSEYQRTVNTFERWDNARERDDNISFEFEWELGDFLYNPDQVRISDEARDLVELRNDVLEEVTQFYFQRRQLQIDLLLSPPEDLRERLRMELQLQEVTANVDYLTGGYLTQRLNDVKSGTIRKSGVLRRLFNI